MRSRDDIVEQARQRPLNRPLVWLAAGFTGGVFVAAMGYAPGYIAPAVLMAMSATVAVVVPERVTLRFITILIAAFAAGVVMWNIRRHPSPGDSLSAYLAEHPAVREITVTGRARLAGLEQDSETAHFFLDVDNARVGNTDLPLSGVAAVRWTKPGFNVYANDLIQVRGSARINLSTVNPGISSYEDYLRGQGIHSAIDAWGGNAMRAESGGAASPRWWASRLRQAQADRLARAVPESALPFVRAIWLGYRSKLNEDDYRSFVETGTAHILSVSGIHMAMIYLTVNALFRLFIRRRRLRTVLVIVFVLLFAAASGVRPSALRAALMILVYLTAELYAREPDPLSAMSLSSILLLAWRPQALFDAGFQLSFLSIASILVFSPQIYQRLAVLPRQLHGAVPAIATSASAQILPTPLALNLFHVLPLGAIPANLVIVPMATAALWLTFITTVVAFIAMPVAAVFGHALAALIWAITAIARAGAAVPFLHILVSNPTIPAVVFYYTAGYIFVCPPSDRRRANQIAFGAAILGTAILWQPVRPEPIAVFLDVGHGDAAFLRTPQGRTLLVDGGNRTARYDAGRSIVAPFLLANHVRRLDIVAVSHADSDHLGGLIHVVEHFPVGEVIVGNTLDTPLGRQFADACARRGITIRQLYAGDTVRVDDLCLRVLHPSREFRGSVNETSLVSHTEWLGRTFLFSGDIEAEAEAVIAANCPRTDILKVPHHGSKTSSTPAFIDAVNATQCIVSTGGNRGKEHADETVLGRYRDRGSNVWRTDRLGAISLCPDGGPTCERARRGYPIARESP